MNRGSLSKWSKMFPWSKQRNVTGPNSTCQREILGKQANLLIHRRVGNESRAVRIKAQGVGKSAQVQGDQDGSRDSDNVASASQPRGEHDPEQQAHKEYNGRGEAIMSSLSFPASWIDHSIQLTAWSTSGMYWWVAIRSCVQSLRRM